MILYKGTLFLLVLSLLSYQPTTFDPDNRSILELPPWAGKPIILCSAYPMEDTVFHPDTRGRKFLYEKPIPGFIIATTKCCLYFSEKLKYNDSKGILRSAKRSCIVGFALGNEYYRGKDFIGSKFIKSMIAIQKTKEDNENEN